MALARRWQACAVTQRDPFLFRLGRSAARHRGRFLGTWLVLVVLGFVTSLGLVGNESLFDRLQSGDIVAPGQAQTGRDLLARPGVAGPDGDAPRRRGRPHRPGVGRAVGEMVARVRPSRGCAGSTRR